MKLWWFGPSRCVNGFQPSPGRRDHLPVVRQLDVVPRLGRRGIDVEAEVDDLAVEVGVHGVLRRGRRRQDVLLRDLHVLVVRLLVVLLDAGARRAAPRPTRPRRRPKSKDRPNQILSGRGVRMPAFYRWPAAFAIGAAGRLRRCYDEGRLSVRTLLIVPGLFGTEILDAELGPIWGPFRCLYRGPAHRRAAGAARARRPRHRGASPWAASSSTTSSARSCARSVAPATAWATTCSSTRYDWRQRVVDDGPPLAAEIRRLAEAVGRPHRPARAVERRAHAARRVRRRPRAARRARRALGPAARGLGRDAHRAARGLPVRAPRPHGLARGVRGLPGLDGLDPLARDGRLPRRRRRATRAPRPLRPRRPGGGCASRCSATIPIARAWVEAVGKRLARPARDLALPRGRRRAEATSCASAATGLPTQRRIVVERGRVRLPGEGNLRGLPAAAIVEGDGTVTLESARVLGGRAAPRHQDPRAPSPRRRPRAPRLRGDPRRPAVRRSERQARRDGRA